MTMRSLVIANVFLGLFLLIEPVYGAAVTGKISGKVVDDAGKPLSGVRVSVTGTGLPGNRVGHTRDSGMYRIVLLPPGRYDVRAELDGYGTVVKRGVMVGINVMSRLDMTMAAGIGDMIMVDADAPFLDTTSVAVGGSIPRSFHELLPGNDSVVTTFTMVGNTVAVMDDPNVSGATRFDNLYLYDGVETTDPVTNTLASNLNADAIAAVDVRTGGFTAEYGRAMGGIFNIVTKSGGERFEGIVRFRYVTDTFTAKVKDPEIRGERTLKDSREPTISLGGPILRDHLWFFLSYRRVECHNTIDVRNEYLGDNQWHMVSKDADELWQSWAGKLTWAVNPSNTVEYSFSADPAEIVGRDTAGIYRPEAHAVRKTGGERHGLSWNLIQASDLFWDTRIGYFNSSLHIKPEHDSGRPSVYDPVARMYFDNYPSINENDRSRTSFTTTLTVIRENMMGTHEFKTGFDYQLQQERTFFNYPGGARYWIYNYGTENEIPDRRTSILNPKVERSTGTLYALFLQDAWEVRSGLTLHPGIRYDYARYLNKVERHIHTFDTMIAPRLGVTWDVTGDDRSRAFAFIGRYYNPLDLGITQIDPGPFAIEEEWRYDPDHPDADEDGWYQMCIMQGEEIKEYKDPHLKPEYTDEFVIGHDHEIMPRFSVGGTLTWRKTRDIIEDVGVWVDENGKLHTATDVDTGDQEAMDLWYDNWLASGQHHFVTNPSGAWRDYRAIEVHARARMPGLSAEVSYTYSEAKGTGDNTIHPSMGYARFSTTFDTPWLGKNIEGYLPYDTTHHLKIFLAYELPWQSFIGTRTWYRSGYTYSKRGEEERFNGWGADGEVLLEKRGSYRYPDVFMVDVSLRKDFSFGSWGTLTGIIDCENLLDNQVPLSRVNSIRDGNFGQDNGWAAPRSVSFQIAYAF